MNTKNNETVIQSACIHDTPTPSERTWRRSKKHYFKKTLIDGLLEHLSDG
jgi:hypothetical protein